MKNRLKYQVIMKGTNIKNLIIFSLQNVTLLFSSKNRFFVELDKVNQQKLIDYVMNNY